MPGLFGVFSKVPDLSSSDLHRLAERMANSMKSSPWLKVDLWGDNTFCGGRVHLGILNSGPQPMVFEETEKRLWFDGEVFSTGNIGGITPKAAELSALLGGKAGLEQSDGVFAGACFDSKRHELTLANDRLGLRPLYYTETKEWFAYAAEVKALLAILESLPALDEIGLRQFFGFGHMIGERTWWKGIELLPPASLWRISRSGKHQCQYWSFDNIRHDPQPEREVLDEFKRLWAQSVSQRSKPAISPFLLSGGLDSRLLLAELREQGRDLVAITFGGADSPDMTIARRCAEVAQVPHRSLLLNRENWLEGRGSAIAQTDGLVNCIHLHAVIASEVMHTGNCYSPMNLAGDLLFGGSFLTYFGLFEWPAKAEDLLATSYLPNPFFGKEEVITASVGDALPYIRGPRSDCYFLSQRVRRFTLNGPLTTAPYCESSFPSLSLPLLRLFLGNLTDAQRTQAKFYTRFLLRHYPKYFRRIPWQKTGRPLSQSRLTPSLWNLVGRVGRAANGIRGCWRISRMCSADNRSFADFPTFLDDGIIVKKILEQELLVDEILRGAARQAMAAGSAKTRVETLTGILTMETMLRKATGARTISIPGFESDSSVAELLAR